MQVVINVAKYSDYEEESHGVEYYFDYLAAHQGFDLIPILESIYNDMDGDVQPEFLDEMAVAWNNFHKGEWTTWAEWLDWLVEYDWADWDEIRDWYDE